MALLSSYLVDYIEGNIPVFSASDSLNTAAFSIALAGVVVGAVIAILFLRTKVSYRNYDPDDRGAEWRGMKKTLLLFIGFVLLLPAAEIVRLLEERFLFSSIAWDALAEGGSKLHHSWWSSAIIFSSAMRGLLLALALAVAVLVILKRRVVRWALPLYLLIAFIAGAVENSMHSQILSEDGEAILQQEFDRVAGVLTLVLILVPYLWVSKRVHATFRE